MTTKNTENGGTYLTQGAAAWETCFHVTEPHHSWGGITGFIKVLEIHDAPEGYPRFVVMRYENKVGYDFCYAEQTDAAEKAMSHLAGGGSVHACAEISGITKIIEPPSIYCEPWCLAESRELVCGDYALPSSIFRNDEKYPMGSEWLIFAQAMPRMGICKGVFRNQNRFRVYFDNGEIATAKHHENPATIIRKEDAVWESSGKVLSEFWNGFLRGNFKAQEVAMKSVPMMDDMQLELTAAMQSRDPETYNFYATYRQSSTCEAIVSYARMAVPPRQLTGMVIDEAGLGVPEMLCKLFKK